MRICLVSPSHLATNPRLVKEALALKQAGHHVTVVCGAFSQWGVAQDGPLAKMIGDVRPVPYGPFIPSRTTYVRQTLMRHAARLIAKSRSRLPQSLAGAAIHPATSDLAKAAVEVRADVYVAHYVPALPAAVLASQIHQGLYFFDAEDFHLGDLPDAPEHAFEKRLIRTIEGQTLPRAHAVTAASPLIAAAYQAEYRLELPTVVLNVFPRISEQCSSVVDAAVISRPSIYWFSQTIGPGRGLEAAVQAISLSHSRPHLYVRGIFASNYDTVISALSRQHRVADRVHVLGPLAPSDVELDGRRFDLGYVGELGETGNRRIALTNKLFSYLSSGLSIVASDIPAHCEIAADLSPAMSLFRAGDPHSLAVAIDRALEPSVLAHAKRASFKLAQEKYNWEAESKVLVGVFASLSNTRSPQSPISSEMSGQ